MVIGSTKGFKLVLVSIHTCTHTRTQEVSSQVKTGVGVRVQGESCLLGPDNDSTQNILVLLCTEGRAVLMEPKADG